MPSPHLRRLELSRFTVHASTAIDLPETGIVLVTGENGSGKSSLIEAVPRALWNVSARESSSPWAFEGASSVRVVTDRLDVTRTRSAKGRMALEWNRAGEAPEAWETATKAQDALALEVGPADLWLRRHVFRASAGNRFAAASDAERKRLLEAVLGVDAFDPALARCREALAAVTADVRDARGAVARAEGALDAVTRAAESAGPEAPDPAARDAARAALAAVTERAEALTRAFEEAQEALSAAKGAERDARARVSTLSAASGDCPTCRRPLEGAPDPAEVEAARAAMGAALDAVSRAQYRAGEAQRAKGAVDFEARGAAAELSRLQAVAVAHDAWAAREATRTREALERARVEVDAAREALEALELQAAELQAAELVLGVRGARSVHLAEALPALSDSATAWMARLGREWSITLAPTTERKSGSVDAISLTLSGGAGCAGGYHALSTGEQRRVDVALVLALGDLSRDTGEDLGTMFFDEVLDAPLDPGPTGAGAMIEVVTELAVSRAVVVVAHSADVQRNLHPARHYHVTAGTVVRLR